MLAREQQSIYHSHSAASSSNHSVMSSNDDPVARELQIADEAHDNFLNLIQNHASAISLLSESSSTGDFSHSTQAKLRPLLHNISEELLMIGHTPELYTGPTREQASTLANTIMALQGNTGKEPRLLVNALGGVHNLIRGLKEVDANAVDQTTSSIHYDPTYPYLTLTDKLAQQAYQLRNSDGGSGQKELLDEMTLTVSQLLTPISYVQNVRNTRGVTREFLAMRQMAPELRATLGECETLIGRLQQRLDPEDMRALTVLASGLTSAIIPPPSANGSIGANGKHAAANGGDLEYEVQKLFTQARTTLDMFEGEEDLSDGARAMAKAAFETTSVIRGHPTARLDRVRLSMIASALQHAAESKSLEEAHDSAEFALRNVKHLAKHHGIELRMPPQGMNDDGEDEATEEVEEGLQEIIGDLEEGKSLDKAMARRIKHVVKAIETNDPEIQGQVDEIRHAIKGENRDDVNTGELVGALSELSIAISPSLSDLTTSEAHESDGDSAEAAVEEPDSESDH